MVRQDVDDRCPLYPVRMVETHARCGAGAAVVPGDEEFAVAELLHDLDLILRHRAERIVDVVFAAVVGSHAVAIAAQIGGDDMEPLGKTRRDLTPGGMGKRISVQQQQRRAVAAVPQMDSRAASLDFCPGEALEHPLPPFRRSRADYTNLPLLREGS